MVCYSDLFPGDAQFEGMFNSLAVTVQGSLYSLITGNGYATTYVINDDQASWNQWKGVLKNGWSSLRPAAMFCFTHGADTSIGPNQSTGVSVDDIESFLNNGIASGTTNFATPFGFVFLDGCFTAKGNWPIAFGIETRQVLTAEYNNRKIPPRAFVGWTKEENAGVAGSFTKAHSDLVTTMFSKWSSGFTLQDAISAGMSKTQSIRAPSIFGDVNLKWNWTP